jgi:hypothetical protein
MYDTPAARSALHATLSAYLASKSGPLRLERIARYALAGLEWQDLDLADKRIIRATVASLGFRSEKYPTWFRTTAEDIAAVEATPAWLTRKAAA